MFTCGLLFLIFLPHSGPGVCVNGQQSNVSGRNDCEVGKELVVVMSTINSLYWNCWYQVSLLYFISTIYPSLVSVLVSGNWSTCGVCMCICMCEMINMGCLHVYMHACVYIFVCSRAHDSVAQSMCHTHTILWYSSMQSLSSCVCLDLHTTQFLLYILTVMDSLLFSLLYSVLYSLQSKDLHTHNQRDGVVFIIIVLLIVDSGCFTCLYCGC